MPNARWNLRSRGQHHLPRTCDPFSYTANNPPGGMAIWTGGNNTISQGTSVHWTVHAPTGLTIPLAYIRILLERHQRRRRLGRWLLLVRWQRQRQHV